MTDQRLPSWRPGATRDTILAFLDDVGDVPPDERVAYLDNDGTMWCEKPNYVQLDFFVDALRRLAADDPSLAARPELGAVLRGDQTAIGQIGIARVAGALAGLFDGRTPGEFAAAVEDFAARYRHPTSGASLAGVVYQPMLELLDALRAHDFAVGIVTGGGTEFVRALAPGLYGIPPERVVGTMIGYEFDRDDAGRPRLRRTASLIGDANEGAPKVNHIQSQLGRAPIFAAGNSGGDREMLEWACAGRHPGLAVLIHHDDAEREFAYQSTAATLAEDEAITEVADRLGWTTVSMRDDWTTIFG